MTANAGLLQPFWIFTAVHLWQTALVWGVLLLFSRGLRRAPARWTHRLWTAGLAKLFLPLALFGGMTDRALGALGLGSGSGGARRTLEAVAAVFDPARDLSLPLQASSSEVALLLFTLLWLGGVVGLSGRLVRDLRRSRLDGRGRDGLDPANRRRLDGALAGSGIPPDRIRITKETIMPSVAGILRPRIFVPEQLLRTLDREELQAVLLHEDEHRLRLDPLRGLAQRLALVLFYFFLPLHPLLRRLRETAEFACDEGALGRAASPAAYRRALVRTLRSGLPPAAVSAAGLGGGPALLRRRFDRLAQPGRYRNMSRYRLIVLSAVFLVAAGSFLPLGVAAKVAPVRSELTKFPVAVHTVAPEYPAACRKAGVSGRVEVAIVVSETGRVDRTEVMAGVEACPALDAAAVEAAVQWRFEPGEIDGKPVPVEMLIPFQFELH